MRRKGPLDPPPGASLAGETQPDMPGLMSQKGRAARSELSRRATIRAWVPTASRSPERSKKRIPLDSLLN